MDIWLVYALFIAVVLLIFLLIPAKEEKDVPEENEESPDTRCPCCCPCRRKACRAFDKKDEEQI